MGITQRYKTQKNDHQTFLFIKFNNNINNDNNSNKKTWKNFIQNTFTSIHNNDYNIILLSTQTMENRETKEKKVAKIFIFISLSMW